MLDTGAMWEKIIIKDTSNSNVKITYYIPVTDADTEVTLLIKQI